MKMAQIWTKQMRNFSMENKMKTKTPTAKVKNTITKEMTFAEIMEKHPDAANVLFNNGMHCIGCGAAMYETLEQGCLIHGMNQKQIDDLIKRLNKK